ncbi:MAG: hypothetical protein ACYDIA_01815 [Candidatus Humimicrobiaceae bacterium]
MSGRSGKRSDRSLSACKAWETMYKRTYDLRTEEEVYQFYMDREEDKTNYEERKRIRGIIRYLGGLKDTDYNEDIPVWAKRKTGRALDEIADEVNGFLPEYQIYNDRDVFNLVRMAGV